MLIFICFLKYETIETHARAFLTLNILSIDTVYDHFNDIDLYSLYPPDCILLYRGDCGQLLRLVMRSLS